jgi:hypothetical protein
MTLKINCNPNKKGEYFNYTYLKTIDSFKNNELLEELKKRKIITEEIIYKVNK